jgi:hypothetical protein
MLITQEGDVYQGQWEEDLQTGKGTYLYSETKDCYSG